MTDKSSKRLNEIQSVITSLLTVEYSSEVDMMKFDRLYFNTEGEHIPYKEFGYASLAEFLRTIDGLQIHTRNGQQIINFSGKESTRHVSQLIARQRNSSRFRSRPSAHRRISPQYISRSRTVSPNDSREITDNILKIVNECPQGLSRMDLLHIYASRYPQTNLDIQSLSKYLRALENQIVVRKNMVYRMNNASFSRNSSSQSRSLSRCDDFTFERKGNNVEKSGIISNVFRVAPESGGEDYDDTEYNNFDCARPTIPVGEKFEGERGINDPHRENICSFNEDATSLKQENNVNKKSSPVPGTEPQCNENQTETKQFDENDYIFSKNQDYLTTSLNERTQFRLEKLIQNNPDGIWCIDLAKKYNEEYKISLDWENLGFQRIGDFAAHLPHIFRMVGPFDNGDFRLYDAKSPLPTRGKKTNGKQTLTLASQYSVYNQADEIEAIPLIIPTSLSNQLVPDDVMTIGESVGQISVTTFDTCSEISDKKSLVTVRVVEAFTPSFFFIQIEKKRKLFENMMDDLDVFYKEQKAKYSVPIIMLEKGLNIACVFYSRWHRGIIKAIDPKCQVTVLFYDYGTLQTYSPDHIFYLHRSFSVLPAQSIPCGLYNLKPFNSDVWPKNVIDNFIKRVYDRPMWATIGKIDIETNSMLITLTDVSEEDDFHVTDWMLEKKMAKPGYMDIVDPTDLNNYQGDYEDEVSNQYVTHQIQPTTLENAPKLLSDSLRAAYENLVSLLSPLDKKPIIIIAESDSINNVHSSIKKMTLRYFELIVNLGSEVNSVILSSMSEALAKMIMDTFETTLNITQSDNTSDSNTQKSFLLNHEKTHEFSELQKDFNIENQYAKNNTPVNIDSLINETQDQLGNGVMTAACEIHDPTQMNIGKLNFENDTPKPLNICTTEVIEELNLTMEQPSEPPVCEVRSYCTNVNIGEDTKQLEVLNTHGKNGITDTSKSKFAISLTEACKNFLKRQESVAVSTGLNVGQKFGFNAEELKDTNPFKMDLLLDENINRSSTTPPALPPRSKHNDISSTLEQSNKILYKAPPIMYNSLKNNMVLTSSMEMSMSSLDEVNSMKAKIKLVENDQQNYSATIAKINNNQDDDDKGYQSEVLSPISNSYTFQNIDENVKIRKENLHVYSQINSNGTEIIDDLDVNKSPINNNLIFVQLTCSIVCIFCINDEGWIPVHQFRSAFTSFGDDDGFYQFINIVIPDLPIKIIQRENHPALFNLYERRMFIWESRNLSISKRLFTRTEKLALIKLSLIMKILNTMSVISKEEIDAQRTNPGITTQLSEVMANVIKLLTAFGKRDNSKIALS